MQSGLMAIRFEIYRFEGRRRSAAASALKLKIVIVMILSRRTTFTLKLWRSGQQHKPTPFTIMRAGWVLITQRGQGWAVLRHIL